MSDSIRKLIAAIIVVVLIFCLASCHRGSDNETTSAPSNYYYGSTSEPSLDNSVQSESNTLDSNLSTIVLVTKPGNTIPTVMTSRWDTTIPLTTAAPVVITQTTMNFTVPSGYPTTPPVYSTVVPTTMPTTAPTTPSQSNNPTSNHTAGSTGTTVDKNTTKTPQGSDSTTNTTASPTKEPKDLSFYTSFIDYDDNFVMEFEGSGWSGKLKSYSTKISVVVNGGSTLSNIRASVGSSLNGDGRIEITLQTSSAQLQAGDTISFTLPEGMVKTSDGSYYSTLFSTSQIVPAGG